jgi:hypothetical protein
LSVTFPQPFLRPGCRQQLGEGVWWQPPNTTDKQEKAPTDRAARHTQWEPRRPLSENYRSNSYTVVNRANGC